MGETTNTWTGCLRHCTRGCFERRGGGGGASALQPINQTMAVCVAGTAQHTAAVTVVTALTHSPICWYSLWRKVQTLLLIPRKQKPQNGISGTFTANRRYVSSLGEIRHIKSAQGATNLKPYCTPATAYIYPVYRFLSNYVAHCTRGHFATYAPARCIPTPSYFLAMFSAGGL